MRKVTSYLFLDGGCLRARVQEIANRYCDGGTLEIDWLRPAHTFTKVFYYDALPCQLPDQTDEDFQAEHRRVEEFHDRLANLDRFRVNQGHTRYSKGRGREQKKVDVMIAVDMLTHTIRRNMDEATLLAGDGDFTPLLDALSNEGMFVTLLHPPRASKELRAAADARRELTVRQIYDWLTPASQSKIGTFPTASWSSAVNDPDCTLIWSEQDSSLAGLSVWGQTGGTFRISWPVDQPPNSNNPYFTLGGGSWKNTKLVAEDDHRIRLPSPLPAALAQL